VTFARHLAGAVAFIALGACSLAINLDSLHNGICNDGEKACDSQCVPLNDPEYGCASTACAPCTLPNATAVCTATGTCAIGSCVGTHQDCNMLPQDGCEIDVNHDPLHCGDCKANPCQTANGTPGCTAGHCSTGACKTGFDDCNGNPLDGCEADLNNDAMNCGMCKIACTAPQTCQKGHCM
jgi:hypothetical protein